MIIYQKVAFRVKRIGVRRWRAEMGQFHQST